LAIRRRSTNRSFWLGGMGGDLPGAVLHVRTGFTSQRWAWRRWKQRICRNSPSCLTTGMTLLSLAREAEATQKYTRLVVLLISISALSAESHALRYSEGRAEAPIALSPCQLG